MAGEDTGVQEATAALKGLLGIGGGGGNSIGIGGIGGGTSATEVTTTEVNTTTTPQPQKKKKKNKKKPPRTPTQPPPPNNNNNNTKGKKSKSKKNNKPPASENFAWSAFQSSPDASKLPIPAFLAADGEDATQKSITFAQAIAAGTTTKPLTDEKKITPHVPNAAAPTDAAHDEMTADKNPTVAAVVTSPLKASIVPAPEDEVLTSSTGINLAAKIKSPSIKSATPVPVPPSPLPSSSNDAYHPPHLPHPQQQLQPQPQYMIVPVQVPPLHMMNPQRTILVRHPLTGAPTLPVTIPPHYPPGAWLQVPVPLPPHPQAHPPQQQQHPSSQYYPPVPPPSSSSVASYPQQPPPQYYPQQTQAQPTQSSQPTQPPR